VLNQRASPTRTPRLDVVAGLTAAAVVVPEALAYATIAGLPVQVGLYTASVYTALKMLIEAEEKLRRQGVILRVASLTPDVKVVQQSPLGRTLGRERMFFNVQAAVQHYERNAGMATTGTGVGVSTP
jgi:hypothetical protein